MKQRRFLQNCLLLLTTLFLMQTPLFADPIIVASGQEVISESCSPASGAIDPAETVTVDLSIRNTGDTNTSNLVGTLLPITGFTFSDSSETYGAVVAGGAEVTRSFTFTADPLLLCGRTITLSLQLQDGSTNLGIVDFSFTIGAVRNGPALPAATYSSGMISAPISILVPTEIPIMVSDLGVVSDINVNVRLNYPNTGNLVLTLTAPDGSIVILANRRGSGSNFGSGSNNCSSIPTVFDDSAITPISLATSPFAGTFRPDSPLSELIGKNIYGIWKFQVTDLVGTLIPSTVGCVQLEISRRELLCCPFDSGLKLIAAAPPAIVISGSCDDTLLDPNETVTVEFPLQNIGTALTTNLVATLLPGGGVLAPSGPQNYGELSPVGPAVSRSFTFVVGGTCGQTVTATLHLQDGTTDLGNVTFTILPIIVNTFSNPQPITILDSAPASPYPSTILVSGIGQTAVKVTATISNINHTFPADIDILLVGPQGQKLLLMSDVGSSSDLINVTLTFDDSADTYLSTFIVSGTYKPTNFDAAADSFPAPAPAGPYPNPQLLSVFNGTDPNGIWSLYVVDDAGADVGTIAGGWSLNISTLQEVCCDNPCILTPPANIVVPNDPDVCGAFVNYDMEPINGSCGVVTSSHPSGSFFPIGITTVTLTATRTDNTTTTATFTVEVKDVQKPSVKLKMKRVQDKKNSDECMYRITFSADDNCPDVELLAYINIGCEQIPITNGQLVSAKHDVNHCEWRIDRKGTLRLDSDKAWLTVTATDASGNITIKTKCIPMRKK